MKKKVLTVALVVVLIAIMVGGTLAWFTDDDQATNTFTIGSIQIVQHEREYDENKELVDFTQGKVLLPVVDMEDPASDDNYQDKIVTVENTGDNDAYVRTWIAIPKALKDYLILDVEQNDGWEQQRVAHAVEIDGVEYLCYLYVYNPILSSEKESSVLLKGVYLDASVDIKDNPDTESTNLEFCKWNADTKSYAFSGFEIADASGEILTKINVLVATQAVQAQGFEDAKAQGALNSAHGDAANVTSVPWYVAS